MKIALDFAQRKAEKLNQGLNSATIAIKLNPSHHEGYYIRGLIFLSKDDLFKACIDLRRADRLGNENAARHIDDNCK